MQHDEYPVAVAQNPVNRLAATRTDSKQRATMKRIFERHDAALMAAVAVMSEFTRQF